MEKKKKTRVYKAVDSGNNDPALYFSYRDAIESDDRRDYDDFLKEESEKAPH